MGSKTNPYQFAKRVESEKLKGNFPFLLALFMLIGICLISSCTIPSQPTRFSETSTATPSPPPIERSTRWLTKTPLPTFTTIPAATPQPTQPQPSTYGLAPEAGLLALLPLDKFSFWWEDGHRFSWSHDSQSIAFPYRGALWLARAPLFAPRLLAQKDGWQPLWSPDCEHIAFVAERFAEGKHYSVETIYLVNTDDLLLRDLLPGELAITGTGVASKSLIRWLDDDTLTFKAGHGTGVYGLYQVDIFERGLKPLIAFPDGVISDEEGTYYHWAPTLDYIAVVNAASGLPHIFLVELDSGEVTLLSSEKGLSFQEFEDWAPDGRRFLYEEWSDHHPAIIIEAIPDLYIWDIVQGEGRFLLPNVFRASWSPDGMRIAFLLLGEPIYKEGKLIGTDFIPGHPFALSLGILDVATEELVTLIPLRQELNFEKYFDVWYWFSLRKPVWSPDGEKLVYWGEGDDLWIMRWDGTGKRRLTKGLEVIEVVWSPDGSKIAIATFEKLFIIERPLDE